MANDVCEIALADGPLESPLAAEVSGAGAVLDFYGNVRPCEDDQIIDGIYYEAHRAMAEHQLALVAGEARHRFQLREVRLHHRIGLVPSGESSLYLRVAAAHRQEAFAAGQWIMDELKKRVPIWKQPTPTRAEEIRPG